MVVVAKYPVKQILVATDFSGSADAELGIAAQYARALRARLHPLHVFPAIAAVARRLGRRIASRERWRATVASMGTRAIPGGR
jgi:nucleotide-binding universal stress UspA family protein